MLGVNGQGKQYYNAEGKGLVVSDLDENATIYALWKKINKNLLVNQIKSDNYGDKFNYSVTVNGVSLDSWRIFYNDGENIYVILDGLLSNTTGISTKVGLNTSGTYQVNSSVSRADFVNKLNDSTKWSDLISTDFQSKGIVAKGGVDINTFIKSWQDKGYSSITIIGDNNTGYFIDGGGNTKYLNEKDPLYTPYSRMMDNCDSYWLSSPSSNTVDSMSTIRYYSNPYMDFDHTYSSTNTAIRPILILPATTFGNYSNDGWNVTDAVATIEFDNQGAMTSGTKEVNVKFGENMPKITVPTKTEGCFGGYYTEINGQGTKYYDEDGNPLQEKSDLTDNLVLYASWTSDISYKTEYYLQNEGLDEYVLKETVTGRGASGDTVNATIKNYTGFTENTDESDRKVTGTLSKTSELIMKVFYDRNVYTVTLNLNGGTLKESNLEYYIYGVGATLPTNIEKTGSTFVGWYSSSTLLGTPTVAISSTTTGNKTFYAKWATNSNIQYKETTYTMDVNGNYQANSVTKTGATGDSVSMSTTAETGFTYESSLSSPTGTVASDGSTELKVYFSRNKYDLTLNKGTGITSVSGSGKYYYGQEISINAVVSSGYNWLNWTGESTITSQSTKITIPAKAITYTANATTTPSVGYKATTYKMDVNGNYQSNTENKNAVAGTSVSMQTTAETGFTYESSLSSPTGIVASDGSTELKVYYSRNKYTLTRTAETGGTVSGDQGSIYFEKQVTLTATPNSGYIFDGWYEGTTKQSNATQINLSMPSRNLTLTAKFKLPTFVVTFKDGSKEEKQTVSYGQNATAPNWTKSGYLLSWDTSYSNITSDITVNAIWTENTGANMTYKIEYYMQNISLNNYELKDTDNLIGAIGDTVTANKTFIGFTENTSNPNVLKSGIVKADGSLVLKLYFDRNSYTITYNLNGGTINSGNITSYVYGQKVTLPTNVTKKGYTFGGWYDNKELVGSSFKEIGVDDIRLNPVKAMDEVGGKISTINASDYGDKVLYAKWYNNKTDLNIDIDGDGKPDLNIDIDGDGKADLNIDTDGDGKADLNVDVDGDGKADLGIDIDGDGKVDATPTPTPTPTPSRNDAKDDTTAPGIIPQTGITILDIIIVLISVNALIITFYKVRKFKKYPKF